MATDLAIDLVDTTTIARMRTNPGASGRAVVPAAMAMTTGGMTTGPEATVRAASLATTVVGGMTAHRVWVDAARGETVVPLGLG